MRTWHFALAALWLLLLTGCGSMPVERPAATVAKVPVAVPCVADPGPRFPQPDTPQTIAQAPNVAARTDLVIAGQIQRERWIARLEAALAGCK
jgi:hypothetical protein